MTLNLKSGQQILFSSLGREEHGNINKFLETKQIETIEEQEAVATFNVDDIVPMDVEEDEDESSPDEDFNPNAKLEDDSEAPASEQEP